MWRSLRKALSFRSYGQVFRHQPLFVSRPFAFVHRNFTSFSQGDVESSVVSQVKTIDGVDGSMVNPACLFEDIGLDSLAQIEMYSVLEEKFGVTLSDDDTDGVKGVEDLVRIILAKLK